MKNMPIYHILQTRKFYQYTAIIIFLASVGATLFIFNSWWEESILSLAPKLHLQVPPLQHLLDFIYVVGASLSIIFSGMFWGRLILRRICNVETGALTETGLGLWVLSFFSFCAGIAGILYSPVLIIFLAVPFFTRENRRLIYAVITPPYNLYQYQSKSAVSWCLFILFAVYILYNLLGCYLPVAESDGLRYHAAVPHLFFRENRIHYLPLNAFSNFPFTSEMVYIYSFALGRDVIIQYLHFSFFILSGIALLSLWNIKAISRLWWIIAGAWFLSVPFFPVLATWSFNDFVWVFFLFMNLVHLKKYLQNDKAADLILSMLFLGISFSAKYSVLMIMMIEALCLLIFYPRRCLTILKKYRLMAIILFALVVPILPYLIKNTLFTGNPVYPLANTLFNGGEWSAFESEFYFSRTADKGIPKTLPNLFRAPFLLVRDWPRFESWNPGISFLIGFGVLCIPFKGTFLNFYRFFMLLYFIGWFYSYQSNRFLIPLIMGVIPLTCMIFSRLKGAQLIAGVIVCSLTINVYSWFVLTWYAYNPLPYFTGSQSKHQFLEQNISYYPMAHYLNRRQDDMEGYLLFLGEHRRYYFDYPDIYVSDWFDPPYILYFIRRYEPDCPVQFLGILYEKENVQYIFYNQRELHTANNYEFFQKRFTQNEWKFYRDMMTLLAEKKRTPFPGLVLFELKDYLTDNNE